MRVVSRGIRRSSSDGGVIVRGTQCRTFVGRVGTGHASRVTAVSAMAVT